MLCCSRWSCVDRLRWNSGIRQQLLLSSLGTTGAQLPGLWGPSYKPKFLPNYCCCCWVQCIVNKIWPRLWHESKALLNRCPPRRGTGLFSECLVKRGLRLEHKALTLSQRAEERGARGAVWKDRSNCRAGRSPGEAGRGMKEAQMSLWWRSSWGQSKHTGWGDSLRSVLVGEMSLIVVESEWRLYKRTNLFVTNKCWYKPLKMTECKKNFRADWFSRISHLAKKIIQVVESYLLLHVKVKYNCCFWSLVNKLFQNWINNYYYTPSLFMNKFIKTQMN